MFRLRRTTAVISDVSLCSQRSRPLGDLGQRRPGTERPAVAPAQQRRGKTGPVAVRGRSLGRGRTRSLRFTRLLLGMGPVTRVSVERKIHLIRVQFVKLYHEIRSLEKKKMFSLFFFSCVLSFSCFLKR